MNMQLDGMCKQRWFKGITVCLAASWLYLTFCVKHVLCASSFIAVSVQSVHNVPWVGGPKTVFAFGPEIPEISSK